MSLRRIPVRVKETGAEKKNDESANRESTCGDVRFAKIFRKFFSFSAFSQGKVRISESARRGSEKTKLLDVESYLGLYFFPFSANCRTGSVESLEVPKTLTCVKFQ